MGNIHSCLKAVSLFTKDFKLTSDPADLANATGVVLPGDGAFEKAMSNLTELGFVPALRDFVASGKPLFGICIGFQILYQDSEESTTKGKVIPGFGFIHGHIKRFTGKKYKVPHMGWNRLIFNNGKEKKLLKDVENGSYMYFIHSFRPVNAEENSIVAKCCYYDEKFPVIIEKENIFGTQFHPEKSDKAGLQILKNFIDMAAA
ncbi:MAG: imidazole glycerol phosphate synthase subunit HisH [Leptospira sp.]|nr:imidazole glycerol phosphate synthase subunit HisH [Leptospira sp.]